MVLVITSEDVGSGAKACTFAIDPPVILGQFQIIQQWIGNFSTRGAEDSPKGPVQFLPLPLEDIPKHPDL